jgi:hypothetical protein
LIFPCLEEVLEREKRTMQFQFQEKTGNPLFNMVGQTKEPFRDQNVRDQNAYNTLSSFSASTTHGLTNDLTIAPLSLYIFTHLVVGRS